MVARIENIDLASDPLAHLFEKQERVRVSFARAPGVLQSREGGNRYQIGDALVTGSTGDQWVVSRARFDQKYQLVAPGVLGGADEYENIPKPVLARQIAEAFTIARSEGGDWISGEPMDWLIQYAPGDFGIVQNTKFRAVYRTLPAPARGDAPVEAPIPAPGS